MTKSVWFAGLFLVLISTSAHAKLRVVITTQDPASITAAIGGDRVDVSALAKGYQDPHFLEAKPSYMLALNRADLFEYVGLDLEAGYLTAILTGARNSKIQVGQRANLNLSEAIRPLEVVAVADRGQGDIHPFGNPHYWLDPENGRLLARLIASRLSEIDPAGKEIYAGNLVWFEKRLDEKMADWTKRLSPLAGASIITYHRSWSYFASRFKLDVVAFVEPKPGIPPTPSHTSELIQTINSKHVRVILMENFYDRRVPDLIASKTKAKVVLVAASVNGSDDAKDYFSLFEAIVGKLQAAFQEI
jgi:zinc/manganese transport system substrate-binding protein